MTARAAGDDGAVAAPPPAARLHGLDAARAVAVALVVAVHGLLPFMTTPVGWAVQDRARHPAVDLVVWCARGFIIPVFFWISGFLARRTIRLSGVGGFVRGRVRRVAIPFLALLVPSSFTLGALWDAGRRLQERSEVAAGVPALRGRDLTITPGHLWYLYYLLLVSAVAAVAFVAWRAFATAPGAPKWATRAWSATTRAAGMAWAVPYAPVLVAVPLAALLWTAGKLQLDTPLVFAVDPAIVLYHAVFFAWGWASQARAGALAGHGSCAWLYLVAALALLPAIVPALRQPGPPPLLALGAGAAFSSLATAAFVGLALRLAASPGAALRLFASAAYWCYLVHLPLLVALQLALHDRPWPAPIKYALTVGATLAACLVSHRLVVRRTVLARFVG